MFQRNQSQLGTSYGADIPAAAGSRLRSLKEQTSRFERRIAELADRWFELAGRIAIFVIYFWFGLLKLFDLSPATPLASALTSRTIGIQYFNASFKTLAVYECALGIIFLIPALTRIAVALLVIHMGIVSSPLVIVADIAWTHPLVPTLEGQYIIKDLAIIALAAGIMAHRRLPKIRLSISYAAQVFPASAVISYPRRREARTACATARLGCRLVPVGSAPGSIGGMIGRMHHVVLDCPDHAALATAVAVTSCGFGSAWPGGRVT